MRANWTRDEVILGLDVLFSEVVRYLSANHPAIIELSNQLNRPPIIPHKNRNRTFRNTAGVSSQLSRFLWSLKHEDKHANTNIGNIFFEVYYEFRNDINALHNIAQAIRRCESIASTLLFGDEIEADGFPEGAILAHLHRYWEKQYGSKTVKDSHECEICGFQPRYVYLSCLSAGFLEQHLLIPPTEYKPEIRFSEKDFITVCPNCHRALHFLRPWANRETCEKILKSLK